MSFKKRKLMFRMSFKKKKNYCLECFLRKKKGKKKDKKKG